MKESVVKLSGVEKIAAERARQVSFHGYTPDHDDTHANGELSSAAIAYLEEAFQMIYAGDDVPDSDPPFSWPFEDSSWNPSVGPIRNLVKAGALIVAQIEMLERLQEAEEEVA